MLATELAELTELHRSTVSEHAKNILRAGVFHSCSVPGTEKKHRPTLMYDLSPDIDKDELLRILSFVEPFLFEDVCENQGVADTISTENESFEQQIAFVLTRMAEEIVSLRDRIAELEQEDR